MRYALNVRACLLCATGGGEHARPREEGVRGPRQRQHPLQGGLV